MRKILASAVLISAWLLGACTTIPIDERAEVRDEIDTAAEETIASLISSDPGFQQDIDASVGYFVARISATKIPLVGAGYGIGVLFDKESGSHTYMNVSRADLGAGLGASRFRVMVLFENREVLEQFRSGVWKSGLGAASAAGTQSAGRYSASGDGYSVHLVSESGAAIILSARLIRLSVNDDLTGSGVSNVSVPNTGYDTIDDMSEVAPRIWDRKMPFLAQKVLDEGYDLPLPYGIALAYVRVEQELLLTDLEVGINGRDEEPFDWVSFENGVAKNDTVQLKFDTWVFPFMNVFALLGKLDGDAPLDVVIDGNGALDHLGLDCSGIITPPLCGPLQDQTFVLSIVAPFSGNTYSIGTILAGGWNNWFVTIPMSVTYADMDRTQTEGLAYTVTPRFGRMINMGRNGSLALFAGGTYMNTDLTISGTVTALDGALTIDYTVDQVNKDPWNALLGFNWDINKKLSWSAEYNGFVGSRDAFITTLNWRF